MLEELWRGPFSLAAAQGAGALARWPAAAYKEPTAELLYTLGASAEGLHAAAATTQEQRDVQAGQSQRRHRHRRGLVVTALSWNKTGHTLAAAYGRHDIVGWCSEPGLVASWSLARGEAGMSQPERLLRVDCCVTACAFHPTEPALLACGTFNGEVVLFDLGRDPSKGEDPLVAKSNGLGEARHREPVTALVWQSSAAEVRRRGAAAGKAHLLLSLGADGRLLVWSVAGGRLENPIMGYELRCPAPGALSGARAVILAGATCMAVSRGPSGGGAGPAAAGAPGPSAASAAAATFVGTEGGQLLRCFLQEPDDVALREFARNSLAAGPGGAGAAAATSAAATAGGAGGAEQGAGAAPAAAAWCMKSPVRESGYESHAGAVTGVAASPFQADAFLSCGTDGCVRMFHALGLRPALRLYASSSPLSSVQWAPLKPLVFAVAAGDGSVMFFDLSRGQEGAMSPAMTLDAAGGGSGGDGGGGGSARAAAAFNPAVSCLFTAAAGKEVKVWRLPDSLCAAGEDQSRESKLLAWMVRLDRPQA